MKRFFSMSALATSAALAFAQSAMAADMPVKAAPPPPPIYDWSGLYVGVHTGWEWSTVSDNITGGFVQTDSTVENGIIGFHVGIQKEFIGFLGLGGLVIG